MTLPLRGVPGPSSCGCSEAKLLCPGLEDRPSQTSASSTCILSHLMLAGSREEAWDSSADCCWGLSVPPSWGSLGLNGMLWGSVSVGLLSDMYRARWCRAEEVVRAGPSCMECFLDINMCLQWRVRCSPWSPGLWFLRAASWLSSAWIVSNTFRHCSSRYSISRISAAYSRSSRSSAVACSEAV